MYAETGVTFEYFHQQQEVQQHSSDDDFYYYSQDHPHASMGTTGSFMQTPTMFDYNFGGQCDLFEPPEPIMEEPLMSLDPITATISMMSCGEDAITNQTLTVSDIESSIESGQLLSDVFYECNKDLWAKQGNETPISEVLDIKVPTLNTDEKLLIEGPFQKSASSSCLRSMEGVQEAVLLRPNFLDFPVVDFDAVYGMRRAFSEGDIKTLGNGNISIVANSEARKEKLSRYRSKKSRRNFGKKVKYACRKALADSQPRIRGRFAKN